MRLVRRTFTKSMRAFGRHGRMEIASTELLDLHIWRHYWKTAKSCKGSFTVLPGLLKADIIAFVWKLYTNSGAASNLSYM